MDAKELRIGNFINYNYLGVTIVSMIESGEDITQASSNEYDPTPLTEEWLLKFGFRKLWHLNKYLLVLFVDESLNLEYNLQNNILKIVFSEENNDLNIDIGKFVIYRKTDIKYTHQLQNLYFALTGQELTIK